MKNFNFFKSYLTRLRGLAVLILMLFAIGIGKAWGLSSTVTIGSTNYPTAKTGTTVSGTGDLASTWNVTVVANYFAGNDNGIHAGSNSQTATSITLTSSSFTGKTITAVSVTGRDANSTQNNRAVFTAKVNGSTFGSTSRFTTSSDTYTATGSIACTGNVSVEVVRSSAVTKAIYVSAVSVTFSNGGGDTYTVTYSANGGTGTMTDSNSPYASGATVTVLSNSFTAPSGKVFSHWDTKSDDSGTDYSPDATFSISGNTTLYAQWATAYTITYNLNGGTGTTPTESAKASGATFTLHDGTTGITAPSGKVFSKWNDGTSNYDAGDTYTMPSSNVTLTAQWVDVTYYVLIEDEKDIDEGSYLIVYNNTNALNTHYGNTNANTYATYTNISSYYDSKKILSNSTTDALAYTVAETTNGYSIKHTETINSVATDVFLGCNSTNNAGLRWDTPFVSSTDEWTLGVGAITSVAQNTRGIRWNNTSGSYRFSTYSTSGQQAIQLFKKEQSSVTKYTVTYDLNGGDGITPTETKKAKDATFTLHDGTTGITAPSGKVFSKWKDQDDEEYAGGATYTMPAKNVTLTAQWIDIPKYTITYSAGTGSCETSTWTQTSAGESTTLPDASPSATCEANDWEFAGWCITSAGDDDENTTSPGTILAAGSSYEPTSTLTLYAIYTKTVSGSGGGFTLSLVTDKSGSDVEYYIAPRSGSNAYLGSTTNAAEAETFYIEDDDLYYYDGETKTYVNSDVDGTSLTFVTSDPVGWTITETSSVWTFQSKGTGTRHLAFNYNGGNPRFSSYAGSTTYPYQFTKHAGTTYYMTSLVCCNPITPILNYSTTSLSVGGSHATISSITGNTGSATPTYAVTAASPAGCITVNSSTGEVTPVAVGTGTVTATFPAKSTYCSATATKDFTVAAAHVDVSSVSVDPTSKAIVVGETFTITPTVLPANATDKSVSWSSSASGNASVSSGMVTGVAQGSATITCTSNDDNTKKATCSVTVYNITVQKQDETGATISADGVMASATGKSLSASATAASKYVFKGWKYATGGQSGLDDIPSATSTSTTLTGTPTGDVTVIAEFYKPRVVKWSVNGDDTYDEKTMAHSGTIVVADDPSGLSCASTFIAWTDATHNNGQTTKDDDTYYESALYTVAGDFPTITADTTTFYAVFAESAGSVDVNTIMWSEDWTGATTSDGSTGMVNAKPSAQGDHTGKTVYGSATVTYSETDNEVYVRNESTAGNSAPELLIKSNKTWTISGIPTSDAVTLTLSFITNKSSLGTLTVATNEDGKTPTISGSITGSSSPYSGSYTITTDGASTINLTFGNTSNTRLDTIVVKVATFPLSDYVTECDNTKAKITYVASGGGSTTCEKAIFTKGEAYTICSTAPTPPSGYRFVEWNTKADGSGDGYAAGATIPAAKTTGDITLTAQWELVTYTITYNNMDGATNGEGNLASYNITTATIELADPTRGHDRFDGWFTDNGVWSNEVTSIPLGSSGDKVLYAKWAVRHKIVFDAEGDLTTIYRASDENMEDAVDGQGSIPGNPDAPTPCSTKRFAGWSEDELDSETDDEPDDLMKPIEGTVSSDKHFYAVWAIENLGLPVVTVFDDAFEQVTNGTAYGDKGKWKTSTVYGTGTAGEARMSSGSNAGSMDLDLSDKTLASTITITFKLKRYSTEAGSVSLSCVDEGNSASFSPSSFSYPSGDDNWHDCSCTVTNVDSKVKSIHFASTKSKRVYIKDVVVKQNTITYTDYSTVCYRSFTGTGSELWNSTANWSGGVLPTIDECVRIQKDLTVNVANAQAKRIILEKNGSGKTYQLSISAGCELVVADVLRVDNNGTFEETGENDIVINSNKDDGLGALVMGNHDGTNQATVNFYSKSHGSKGSSASVNQFVGTPYNDETNILYNWYNSWVYEFTNTSGTASWKRITDGDGMTPFHGYCVISADKSDGHTYWQQGTLVTSEDQNLTLKYFNDEETENMFANSWMAPIKISAMNGHMEGTNGTIYIFNSGSPDDAVTNKDIANTAGNYSAYTPGTATSEVIPAMQAFTVYATAAGSLSLDYSAYVYDPAVAGTTPVANKAPQRVGTAEDEMEHLKLRVASENGWGDALDIYIREDFSEGFELYYDGPKIEGDEQAPMLYAVTDDGKMAINCVPDAEGTVVGFRRGEDAYYQFTFDYEGDEILYLNDLKEQISTPISVDRSYTFTSAAGDMQARFIISRTPIHNTPTGVEDNSQRSKVESRKLLIDDHVFIIRNGQMYDVTGIRVRESNK